MQPPVTIFDFPLEELRERAAIARKTIAEMRELLAGVMRERASDDAEQASWDEVMKMVHEGLDLVTTLLPGLVSLSPESLQEVMQQSEDTFERGEEVRLVRETLAGLVDDLQRAEQANFSSPQGKPPGASN